MHPLLPPGESVQVPRKASVRVARDCLLLVVVIVGVAYAISLLG